MNVVIKMLKGIATILLIRLLIAIALVGIVLFVLSLD